LITEEAMFVFRTYLCFHFFKTLVQTKMLHVFNRDECFVLVNLYNFLDN